MWGNIWDNVILVYIKVVDFVSVLMSNGLFVFMLIYVINVIMVLLI